MFYHLVGSNLVGDINTTDTGTLVYGQQLYYQPQTSVNLNNGRDVQQSLYVAPVPIPAGIWLLGSGLFGLIGAMRRSFHKKMAT